jgi:hypothetical protein
MTDEETNPPRPPRRDARTFTFRRTFTLGRPTPSDDPNVTIVEGPAQTFEWKRGGGLGHDDREAQRESVEEPPDKLIGKPMTYYEALSGKRDPQRDFFITGRRLLNLSVTLIAIALPIGLMALAFVTGADFQTIVFAGIGGAIVGLMLKTTFPKTPFD